MPNVINRQNKKRGAINLTPILIFLYLHSSYSSEAFAAEILHCLYIFGYKLRRYIYAYYNVEFQFIFCW